MLLLLRCMLLMLCCSLCRMLWNVFVFETSTEGWCTLRLRRCCSQETLVKVSIFFAATAAAAVIIFTTAEADAVTAITAVTVSGLS